MHSISDLTTYCRKTSGDVPSRLVGASTTVVGSKMYLFGGRLVTERKMVSDMYTFDLETFTWEKMMPPPEDNIPGPRYFHSADVWNNQLVICGGMGHKVDSTNPEELCVLNDVRFFNFATNRWLPPTTSNAVPSLGPDSIPKPRYAHLSSISADRLFIIGGQDLSNIWLDDVFVYDLRGKAWLERRSYPRHVGTYRSIAVSSDQRVRLPQEELKTSQATASLGPTGTRFRTNKGPPSSAKMACTPAESLNHLPYSAAPTDDFPADVYLYSNYNFTDVKREFEVFSPLPETDFTVTDRSADMTGSSFPPGLRFPSGAMLGNHFIIAGTYIAHTYQSFSIWALDLLTMQWTRIDPGGAVATGSWFRGCLWADANKFLIFGNRDGNLVEDYNRRLLSWDHVAVIDLESFGIYQPPPLLLDIPMQELGLAALEEGVLADFEVVCDDGRKIRCSRKTLEERWPWFKEQRQKFLLTAIETAETLPTSPMHIPLPTLPGVIDGSVSRPDPRLTPRAFHLSEPYPITLALLQYFYSLALITPLQQAPAVLSQLLVLSSTYKLTHLQSLVKHAMHRMLSNSTSVGVYEVATLCSCRSLQIRALKTVMSYSQKRPSGRSRQDSRSAGGGGGGGGGRRPGTAESGNGPAADDEPSSATARPRGTSDAPFRGEPQNGNLPSGSHIALQSINTRTEPPEASTSRAHAHHPKGIVDRKPRPISVLSAAKESEMIAVAELMSSAIVHTSSSYAEQQEKNSVGLADEPEDFADQQFFGSFANAPASPSERSAYDESDLEHSDGEASSSQLTYPAFHLPRPRHEVITRDCDTPSLSSSNSYSSLSSFGRPGGSTPVSPAALVTPIDQPFPLASGSHLGIIEERISEDQDVSYKISEEPRFGVTVVVPDTASEHDTLKRRDILLLRRGAEPLAHLKLDGHDGRPEETRSPQPSLQSPGSAGSGSKLARFVGVGKKASKTSLKESQLHPVQTTSSTTSTVTPSRNDLKQQKVDEKRRKKDEAKAKLERLALDLKAKSEQRVIKEKRASISSAEKRQAQLADGPATIFGGYTGSL